MKTEGQILRDEGIKMSVENADKTIKNWSEKAYDFFINYIKDKEFFMTEDVRVASEDLLETPPSNRAWGAVTVRAKKEGLIESAGFSAVKNPKAHSTPATLWKVL